MDNVCSSLIVFDYVAEYKSKSIVLA